MIKDRTLQAQDRDPRSPDAIRRRRGADYRLAPAAVLAWLGAAIAIAIRQPWIVAVWGIVAVVIVLLTVWIHHQGWTQWYPSLTNFSISLAAAVAVGWTATVATLVKVRSIDRQELVARSSFGGQIDGDFELVGGVRRFADGSLKLLVNVPNIGNTPVFVSTENITAELSRVQPGTLLRITGRISDARQVELVPVTISSSETIELVGDPTGIRGFTATVRTIVHSLAEAFASKDPSVWGWSVDPSSLLPGMLIGDTAAMRQQTRDSFLATGLSHLTAVSGLHVAIVASSALVVASMCGAGRLIRLLTVASAILVFVFVVGPEPSVVRAGTMGIVGVVAVISSRWSDSLSALSAVILGIVFFAPGFTVQYGFLLSVLATVAIIVYSPQLGTWLIRKWQNFSLRRLNHHPRTWEAMALRGMAVAVVADIATQPVIVWMVGVFSPTAVLANLLVGFAVAPLMVTGLLAAIMGTVLASLGVSTNVLAYLYLPALPSAWWITSVAHHLSQIPVIHTPDTWSWAVAWAVGLLLLIQAWRGKIAWQTIPILCGVVLVLLRFQVFTISAYSQPQDIWATGFTDVSQWQVALCVSPAERGSERSPVVDEPVKQQGVQVLYPSADPQRCHTPYGVVELPDGQKQPARPTVVAVEEESEALLVDHATVIVVTDCARRRSVGRPSGTTDGAIVHYPCADGAGILADGLWQVTGNDQ